MAVRIDASSCFSRFFGSPWRPRHSLAHYIVAGNSAGTKFLVAGPARTIVGFYKPLGASRSIFVPYESARIICWGPCLLSSSLDFRVFHLPSFFCRSSAGLSSFKKYPRPNRIYTASLLCANERLKTRPVFERFRIGRPARAAFNGHRAYATV